MAFKLNKRHKLSAGIVLMILVIALVHLFVFRPPQREYRQYRFEYEGLKSRIERAPNPAGDYNLVKYDQETKEFAQEYDTALENLDVMQEPFWRSTAPKDREKHLEEYHAILKKLIEFRDQYAGKARPRIQLGFLGPNGWDLPERDSIPIEYLRNNSSLLVDRLDAIGDIIDILEVIASDAVREEKLRELYQSLNSIGINPKKLYDLNEGRIERDELGFGEFVPVLKFLSHAFLLDEMANKYKKENPNYEFDEKKFVERAFKHMSGDVKLQYPNENTIYYAHRQIVSVLSILIMMAEDYDPAQPADKKIDKFLVDNVHLFAFHSGAVLTTTTVTGDNPPVVTNLGILLPIEFEFEAENSKAMQFLWRLSHSQNLLDLENFSIRSLREGKVIVRALVTNLSYVYSLSDQAPPAKVADSAAPPSGAPPQPAAANN